jgi:hypothetical protein
MMADVGLSRIEIIKIVRVVREMRLCRLLRKESYWEGDTPGSKLGALRDGKTTVEAGILGGGSGAKGTPGLVGRASSASRRLVWP